MAGLEAPARGQLAERQGEGAAAGGAQLQVPVELGDAQGAAADVSVITYGKALGGVGAAIGGPRALTELLWNKARSLVFSTGAPPAVAAASVAAVGLVAGSVGEELRARLWSNVMTLVAQLRAMGLDAAGSSPIVPLRVGDDAAVMRWTEFLLARGVFVQGIR